MGVPERHFSLSLTNRFTYIWHYKETYYTISNKFVVFLTCCSFFSIQLSPFLEIFLKIITSFIFMSQRLPRFLESLYENTQMYFTHILRELHFFCPSI